MTFLYLYYNVLTMYQIRHKDEHKYVFVFGGGTGKTMNSQLR